MAKLPTSLEEATSGVVTPFGELPIGQRFIDATDRIFEKIAPGEAYIVTGDQAGEFVYPPDKDEVVPIYLKTAQQ